jgi:hypothetical protein
MAVIAMLLEHVFGVSHGVALGAFDLQHCCEFGEDSQHKHKSCVSAFHYEAFASLGRIDTRVTFG